MSQCDPYLHRPKGFNTKTLGPFPTSGPLFEGAKAYMNAGYLSQPILASAATAAAAALTGDVSGSAKKFLLPEACESAFKFTESMGHHSVGCQMFHPGVASCGTATKQLLGRNAVFSFKMYAVLAALTFIARGGNVFQKGYVLSFLSMLFCGCVFSFVGYHLMYACKVPVKNARILTSFSFRFSLSPTIG